MDGLICLHGQQHVENFTMVDHCKPHTYSNELYKDVIMNAFMGVFNGCIFVWPDAPKTNAFQATIILCSLPKLSIIRSLSLKFGLMM